MVYYIPAAAAAPTFSNFSNSLDSKVKVKVKGPNMCFFFKSMGFKDIEYDIPVYRVSGPAERKPVKLSSELNRQ